MLTIPDGDAESPSVELVSPPAVEEEAPLLEAAPTTFDATVVELGYSRLPRGVPRFLGRSLVLKLLGRGPRGKSLLARPLSLAGRVVLKVVASDRERDAVFIERFLREALATAQLSSPHLIPIVDLGRDRASTFTALAYVPGTSLAEELALRGKIEPRLATAWMLQTARGLAVAHAQGIWHRDVKPENLRLTADGLILVDDLGLETTPSLAAAESSRDQAGRKSPRGIAKTAAEDVPSKTPPIQRAAVGTPLYMAPEQARDALMIDGRADIYALGCTYYHLVTGRPPFSRTTATELLDSHQDQAVVPPQEFSPGLSPRISDAMLTMMRKVPEERYPSMEVVVEALEQALSWEDGKLAEDEAAYRNSIQTAASAMTEDPAARLRGRILTAASGAWLAFSILLLALGAYRPFFVTVGFGALAAASLMLASRSLRPSGLVELFREFVLGDGVRSWVFLGLVVLGLLAITVQGGYLCPLLFVAACVGALIGGYLHYVERPALVIHDQAIEQVQSSLRSLRSRGCEERGLRDVLIQEAGKGWESLYAAVFGGRALAAERLRVLHDSTAPGAEARSWWKSRIARLLAALVEMRRETRLRRLFQDVEEARFEAEGLNLLTARRRSWRVSRAMVLAASHWREEQTALQAGRRAPGASGPTITQQLRDAIENPDRFLADSDDGPGPLARRLDLLTHRIFGRTARLVLGAAILGVFA